MVGSGEQDYNHASLIFIAAVTKKYKFVKKMVKILNLYFQNWCLDPVRKIIIMPPLYSSQLQQKNHSKYIK